MTDNPDRRRPQLDSLRALAVAGIMAHHYIGLRAEQFGALGFQLMLVLSGFLITGILLKCREIVDTTSQSPWAAVRRFYARRALRIVPIYYLVIFVSAAVNIPFARDAFWWLVSFTTNFYLSFRGEWAGRFTPFWSLAVQEQFYALWPWLVLLAPRRWLPALIGAVMLMGPLYRFYAVQHGFNPIAVKCLSPASLDALGAGSLLAILIRWGHLNSARARWLAALSCAGLAYSAFFLNEFTPHMPTGRSGIFFNFAFSAAACGLIAACYRGIPGPFGRLLEAGPLVYLGRISYGMYVYHAFVPLLLEAAFVRLGWPYDERHWPFAAFACVVTVAVAAVSWHFVERPLNDLKRHFPYRIRPVECVASRER